MENNPTKIESKPRRKVRGNIALVVSGGYAQIKDAIVISGHQTREAAERAAGRYNFRHQQLLKSDLLKAAYVVWADEFVDGGGVYK